MFQRLLYFCCIFILIENFAEKNANAVILGNNDPS